MPQGDWQDLAQEVAVLLCASSGTVALTGAGISVECGIPAFRGARGLWAKYDPADYATIDAFRADPARVWKMLWEVDGLVRSARPSPAHLALARLEKMGCLKAVVTQNVDGLHQKARAKAVIELHGSARAFACLDCGRALGRGELITGKMPPLCSCGGVVRPQVVFFGEPIPRRAALGAFALASSCQVMLVVGTSAVVAPASHLPLMAKRNGATVVEINLEPTELSRGVSDYALVGGASQILTHIVEAMGDCAEGE